MTAMFRKQGDVDQGSSRVRPPGNDQAADPILVQLDDLLDRSRMRCFVPPSLRVVLHAQESLLLRGVPSEGRYLRLPRAAIEFEEEFLIFLASKTK